MSSLFYKLGQKIGRATIPAIRKTRWLYDGVAGNDEEAMRAEAHLGRALAAELRAATRPVDDPELVQLTWELCQRLAPRDETPRRFRCAVIHDDTPNAVALPGGFIFLNDSLVEFCERRPEELAFVIAHEMAHVIRRHAWDRVLNDAVLRVATTVSGRAGMLGDWLRKSGFGLLESSHSRDQELDADALGLELVNKAGIASGGAITFLERLAGLDLDNDGISQYFASHPPAPERIAHLKTILPKERLPRDTNQSDRP
jgi:predicted Zn-dependent protease